MWNFSQRSFALQEISFWSTIFGRNPRTSWTWTNQKQQIHFSLTHPCTYANSWLSIQFPNSHLLCKCLRDLSPIVSRIRLPVTNLCINRASFFHNVEHIYLPLKITFPCQPFRGCTDLRQRSHSLPKWRSLPVRITPDGLNVIPRIWHGRPLAESFSYPRKLAFPPNRWNVVKRRMSFGQEETAPHGVPYRDRPMHVAFVIASRIFAWRMQYSQRDRDPRCRCDDSRRFSFIDGTRVIIFEKLPRNSRHRVCDS